MRQCFRELRSGYPDRLGRSSSSAPAASSSEVDCLLESTLSPVVVQVGQEHVRDERALRPEVEEAAHAGAAADNGEEVEVAILAKGRRRYHKDG